MRSYLWAQHFFFCNRYLPICMFVLELIAQLSYAPSEKFCSQHLLYSTILGILSAAVVQCVLVTRTHALYQIRWLTISLGILGFLSISSAMILFFIVFQFETFTPASAFGLSGCILACTHKTCKPMLIGFWVPFVLFETIILGLTGWKSFKSLNSSARFSRFPSIIMILFRDGLVYYIVMMSLSVCNFLIWIADPYASYLAVGFFQSLQVILCSRLLLNIRGIYYERNHSSEVNISSIPQSDYYGSRIRIRENK